MLPIFEPAERQIRDVAHRTPTVNCAHDIGFNQRRILRATVALLPGPDIPERRYTVQPRLFEAFEVESKYLKRTQIDLQQIKMSIHR